MNEAEGDVIIPKGMVHVSWKRVDGQLIYEYKAPEGVKVIER